MEIKFGLISADSHAGFDRDDFTSRMSASNRRTDRLASSIFSPLMDPEVSSTTAREIGARAGALSATESATNRTSAKTDVV